VIGFFLDPWLMGSSLNLSPFVILVSITVWGALWGIPGAFLVVPITACMAMWCSPSSKRLDRLSCCCHATVKWQRRRESAGRRRHTAIGDLLSQSQESTRGLRSAAKVGQIGRLT
jgi:hypothetical protein